MTCYLTHRTNSSWPPPQLMLTRKSSKRWLAKHSPARPHAGVHAPLLRGRHKRALHILQHRIRAGIVL